VGLGYFKGNEFQIEQFFLPDYGSEKAFLEKLIELASGFELIVSFNGKSFDINLLHTRTIMQNIAFEWKTIPHLDLLPLARRLWKHELESCALESLEYYILGSLRQAEMDIWGGHIPQVYFNYLDTRNADEVVNIFYHNRSDILSMPVLLHLISLELHEPHAGETRTKFDLFAVGRLYEEMGETCAAIDIYTHLLQNENVLKTVRQQLSALYKKEKQVEKALPLWQAACLDNEIYALQEMAIQLEHQDKNPAQALELVEKAIALLQTDTQSNSRELEKWQKRQQRLHKKLA
jgi:tetratricopeptide (TPR) repeat protein